MSTNQLAACLRMLRNHTSVSSNQIMMIDEALAAFEASGPDTAEAPNAQSQVFKFLMGTDELDGVWFGDQPPEGTRKFWWREHLRAALATPPLQEPLCHCKDRPASQCTEEWGPECDLGNNPAHAKTAPRELEDQLNASVLQEQDKRDAERYRWLLSMAWGIPLGNDCFDWCMPSFTSGWQEARIAFDTVIDSAILAKSQGVGP